VIAQPRATQRIAMIRTVFGLVIGLLLIFPGLELLRWLATKVTGLYPDMTLTGACLGMIIILQSVSIARTIRLPRPQPAEQPRQQQIPRPAPRQQYAQPQQYTQPQYQQPAQGLTGGPVELHPQRVVLDGSVPAARVRRLNAEPRPSRWRNIDLDDTPPRVSRPVQPQPPSNQPRTQQPPSGQPRPPRSR
jgi:hypothetical protein